VLDDGRRFGEEAPVVQLEHGHEAERMARPVGGAAALLGGHEHERHALGEPLLGERDAHLLGVATVDAAVETHRRSRYPDPARASLGRLCTPGLFAAAAWGLGAGSVLLAAWIMRALGRRWLSGARAPLWIDRHARLEGRLATALELERHGGARAPFFPLLVDENARRLAAWRPERLVPEGM